MLPYLIIFLLLFLPVKAIAQEDLIHSDLPIWGYDPDDDNIWPKHFIEGEGDSLSFGCVQPLAIGIWKLQYAEKRNGEWIEFSNYGALHCYLMKRLASNLEYLNKIQAVPSYLIKIDTVDTSRGERELWLIQEGGAPGSDYTLLARETGAGLIVNFEVLQSTCPKKYVREAKYGKMDILSTRYCAINNRRTLKRFAKRMAKLPPLGILTFDEGHQKSDTKAPH